jgi:hypothetical protein
MSTRARTRARTSTRASRKTSSTTRKSSGQKQVALAAARQALDEFATSPERLASLRDIIKNTMFEALEKLGIDTNNPEATRKDMVHLRTWRELMDFMRQQGFGAAVKWIVTAGLAALAVGVGVVMSKSG